MRDDGAGRYTRHRDSVLTETERASSMMVCVSGGAGTELTLDL